MPPPAQPDAREHGHGVKQNHNITIQSSSACCSFRMAATTTSYQGQAALLPSPAARSLAAAEQPRRWLPAHGTAGRGCAGRAGPPPAPAANEKQGGSSGKGCCSHEGNRAWQPGPACKAASMAAAAAAAAAAGGNQRLPAPGHMSGRAVCTSAHKRLQQEQTDRSAVRGLDRWERTWACVRGWDSMTEGFQATPMQEFTARVAGCAPSQLIRHADVRTWQGCDRKCMRWPSRMLDITVPIPIARRRRAAAAGLPPLDLAGPGPPLLKPAPRHVGR